MKRSVGVLGGGQLARMLSESGKKLGIKVFTLSPLKKDPASLKNPLWIKGDPSKKEDVRKLQKKVDVLTFESEFFKAKTLKEVGNNFFPSLKNLSLIQDRLPQKKLLEEFDLPSSPFLKVDLKKGQDTLEEVFKSLGPFVLKKRREGYDGYGSFVFKKEASLKKGKNLKGEFIAEKFVKFKRELAILVARNGKNQIVFFPLVETKQKDCKCFWVKGPVKHRGLKKLKEKIKVFLEKTDYVGVMAFELFDFEGKLLINELAPRVHNSGHYSLDALSESQFDLHLKACLNMDLKTPSLKKGKAFSMINLIGRKEKKPGFKKKKNEKTLLLDENLKFPLSLEKNISLYWYGKKENRKGRKMGHLNTYGYCAEKSLERVLKYEKHFLL